MKHVLTFAAILLSAAPVLASGAEGGANPFAGDVGTAIWTVVIFAVVLLVLGKFAWGPILDGLQSREEFISDSLAKAKEDREAAEARLREYEEKLSSARAEATGAEDVVIPRADSMGGADAAIGGSGSSPLDAG